MNQNDLSNENGKEESVISVVGANTAIQPVVVFDPKTFLETAKTRDRYDPVEGKMVTEYQIPHKTVEIDHKSQNRDTGTPQNVVSQMAHDLNTKGQERGIKVEIGDDSFLLRWGNTRHGGAEALYANENNLDPQFCVIKDCDPGMIWASVWTGKDKDLRRMQAKENNLHSVQTPANVEDNLRSLKDIIKDGHLDYDGKDFEDCDDAEKKRRVKREVEQTMPNFAGKKFKSFYNKFKMKNKSSFQVHSKNLRMMLNHFLSSNPFGIESLEQAVKTGTKGVSYVFKVKHDILGNELDSPELIKIIFANNGVDKGAIFQSAFSTKYVTGVTDKIYSVTAVNPSKSSLLQKFRNDDTATAKKWNNALPKGFKWIDGLLYMPQCTPEDNSPNHWAKVVKF